MFYKRIKTTFQIWMSYIGVKDKHQIKSTINYVFYAIGKAN